MSMNRRNFLIAGTFFTGVASSGSRIWAAPHEPASMTPSEGLSTLLAGNKRFQNGRSSHGAPVGRVAALAGGQRPWAIILSCSDSRVPPELIFDATLGDLFVVRVAGNFADAEGIGSMEYAVEHFASPVLFVLGHSSCGAIRATVDNVKAGSPQVPGNIGDLVREIAPAARAVLHNSGNVYANATAENVRMNVAKISASGPIIGAAIKSGKLRVVGGVYDLKTGHVHTLNR